MSHPNVRQTNALHELKAVASSFVSGDITTSPDSAASILGVTPPNDPKVYYRLQVQGGEVFYKEDGGTPAATDGSGFTWADNEIKTYRAAELAKVMLIAGSTLKLVGSKFTI